MANPSGKLAELLKNAEIRKHAEMRRRLEIAPEMNIEGLQLESLAYHVLERSGSVWVKLDGDQLRVGNPDGKSAITYHGDAKVFLLKRWKISLQDAEKGITIELHQPSE
jgi:hypothetical protein